MRSPSLVAEVRIRDLRPSRLHTAHSQDSAVHRSHRLAQRGDHTLVHPGVARRVETDAHRAPRRGDDRPGRVEFHSQFAYAAVAARHGGHRHLPSGRVDRPQRVGPDRVLVRHAGVAVVAEQVVAPAGDHHVHVGEPADQRHLLGHILEMAHQDDLVHPGGRQSRRLRPHRSRDIRDRSAAGAGDARQRRGDGPDHTDALPGRLHHRRRRQAARGEQGV